MIWKRFLLLGLVLLLLGFTVLAISAQEEEGQFAEVHIFTTASRVVGVGTYVAAEAYGVPAGEDPEEEPAQAIIMPYSIYPNMLIENIEDFVQPEPAVEDFTFTWSLEPAEGSSTELIDGTVAIFMADIEGEYLLTLTATDANGNVGETSWKVLATNYVGNGYLDGPEEAEDQCIDCHDDIVEAWAETGHSDMFVRALNGTLSDHYGPNCISCHTTGFNNRPEAVNGGFDDLAAEAGWVFPKPDELTEGGWDAFVEGYPEVAAMANIQCESCHGPGYLHVFEATRRDSMISLGLDYGVCAQCHGEEPYHVFPQQWETSAHAQKAARAFWYPIGEDHASCVRCHSGAGYIDWVNGEKEPRTDYQVITCAVCHDPHDAGNPHQLRVFDSVVLPDGTEVADAGPAATCMSCHNARRSAVATVEGDPEDFSTPHYSTAGELMTGVGGYTWGETLPVSTHGRVVEGTCIGCHMAATPGMNDMGTPDDNRDDTPLPGRHTVGEHTFAMVDADGVENVAVCQQCHDAATSFAFEARRDYDGDGAIETNQEEVEGLRELLQAAIVEAGVEILDHHPYFEIPENTSTDVYGAIWNLKFSESGGTTVHNLRYTVSLLQLSYEKLAGEAVPGATILPPK